VSSVTQLDHLGVVVGVDTHKDEHVAVAIDERGARLGECRLTATGEGYARLASWARALGPIVAFGVEGTGSYGAGVARFLTGAGHTVVEVNRPDRSTRRRIGKSDPIDAEMAARSVHAGVATGRPKSVSDRLEMIRMLKVAKDSAVRARTQAVNQIKALVVTAPAELRASLTELPNRQLIARCAAARPGPLTTPMAAAKHALRSLARRHLELGRELDELETQIATLTAAVAPRLRTTFGIGADTAATLLVAAGDNPHRLHSEAAFAALCGTNPIPASSGKTDRHRLNRGGNRQANAALHRVVVVRLRWHQPTKDYAERRLKEGKTKAEIMRCLKRFVAREVFAILRDIDTETAVRVA